MKRPTVIVFSNFPLCTIAGSNYFVARRVTTRAGIDLTNAAATVDEHFVETATIGLILGFIPEVPFSEDATRCRFCCASIKIAGLTSGC